MVNYFEETFGSKMDEISEQFMTLHKDNLRDLYKSHSLVRTGRENECMQNFCG